MEWVLHHKLIREVTLNASVEALEPLRVGVGRATTVTSPTDLPVVKLRVGEREVPVIPGSSWKGVFRSTAYKLALVRNVGHTLCTGLAGHGEGALCFDRELEEGQRLGVLIDGLEQEGTAKAFRKAAELIMKHACILCKVFGSVGYASHVFFADSLPKNGRYRLGYRAMVALDRRTGTVARGPFTPEFVEPGSVFTFELRAVNLPNYALGLLADVVFEIQAGRVKVGGFKSRGFGRVRFTDITLDIYDYELGKRPEDRLKPLDGFDEEVEIEGEPWARHEDALALLRALQEVWIEVAPKLRP